MLNQADITSTIKSVPWFLELAPESVNRLSGIANLCSFNAGDIIFNEGEQHPILYILLEGKVLLESFVPGHGALPIFVAESLDVIGWSSLTPMVRQKTSTARVQEYTVALSFSAESLMELCESDSELGFIVMRRIANIVASRYLNHRLHLLELISDQGKG